MSSSVYISYSYIDEYINTGNSICTFFAATSTTTGSTVTNTTTTITTSITILILTIIIMSRRILLRIYQKCVAKTVT